MRSEKKKRPDQLEGRTIRIATNAGVNLYLTLNAHEGELFEVFARTGKAGGDLMSLCEAIARMISLCLRYGIPKEEVVRQLAGVGGRFALQPTIPDAIARALKGERDET